MDTLKGWMVGWLVGWLGWWLLPAPATSFPTVAAVRAQIENVLTQQ